MKLTGSVPRGIFKGQNFMTPNWLAYYVGTHNGLTAYVELAEGRGISGSTIYGVTVRRANGERFDPEPSTMFHSRSAAESYILNGFRGESDE